MAKNKIGIALEQVPLPVWAGLFTLIAAGSIWGDAKQAAKELGKNTADAMKEVERSKTFLIDLPEFKAGYFKSLGKQTVKLFKQAGAEQLAKDLSKVKGFFNDDEDLLYTTLQKINYRTQLAQVAQKFETLTGNNLGAYIVSFTNTNERHRVEQIINEMKSGIV